MSKTNINSNFKDSIPLYSRIQSTLKNKILSGQLEEGERLANEKELAAQYNVSQITIRSALFHLEKEGLITRTRAKGTFVAINTPVQKQLVVTGSMHQYLRDVARYKVKVLSIENKKIRDTRIPRTVANFFNMSVEDTIRVVRRLRFLKNIPIYYVENFIPLEYAKKLAKEELTKSTLLDLLKKKAGLKVGRGEMCIEAVPADLDIAKLLKYSTFESLIRLQSYFWFPSGDSYEMVNAFMRPDYFKYKIDLNASEF